jgi:3-hydroxybutyryl-CoA dehydratase
MDFYFEVTIDLYERFLSITNDTNILHTDQNYAKKHGFKDKVVHGNLLNCFISYIVGVGLDIENVMLINQSINYRRPLYINDKVKFVIDKYKIYESINAEEYIFKVFRDSELLSDGKFMLKIL